MGGDLRGLFQPSSFSGSVTQPRALPQAPQLAQDSIKAPFDPSLERDVALGSSSGALATPGCCHQPLECHRAFLSAELSSSCSSGTHPPAWSCPPEPPRAPQGLTRSSEARA